MKRNSKQTKGWGFKFMAILSSIMMVINTVTPVVPVFAETPNEVIPAEDTTPEEEVTPAGDPAEDTVPADNDADKPATVATPAENPAEGPATVETPKTDEDADKSADSQTITEQTDGNQNSGVNTSNGSDEKENNNTDQSLQNGENPETVETPKADADKPAENVNLEYMVNAKSTKGISLMNVAPTVASIGDTKYTTLMDAVNAAGVGDTISLTADITVNNFTVPSDKDFTLDLNGHTLKLYNTLNLQTPFDSYYNIIEGNLTITDNSSSADGKVEILDFGLTPVSGGKLTIDKGNFIQKYYLFYLAGGELVINTGNFVGTDNIINCYADSNYALGGNVTINGGNFTVTDTSSKYEIAVVMGFENSDITINGGTFNATGDGVSVLIGNGTLNAATKADSNTHNGKITINDGVFDSITAAGGGEMTIIGGTFNGEFGVYDNSNLEIKGGTFALNPSEYLAEGKKVVYDKDWKYEVVNGGTNQNTDFSAIEIGSATTIENIAGEVNLEVIKDDNNDKTSISSDLGINVSEVAGVVNLNFTDENGNKLGESVKFSNAILVKVPVSGTDPVKIKIKHANENFGIRGLATAATTCSGGIATDENLIYTGGTLTPSEGVVKIYVCEASEITAVRLSSSVAELNNTEYGTLEAAVAKAQNGDTITLLTGITLTDTLILEGKDIKLDLGGNTLTGASGKKAIFLKKGNLEISNGTIYSNNQAINVCTTNSGINQTNYTNLKIDSNANIIGSWAVILREAKYSQDSSVNCGGVGNEGYGAKLDIKGTLEGNLWIIGNIESGNSIIDFYGNLISNGAGIAENGAAIVNVYEGASIKAGEYSAIEQRAGTLNVYGGIFESTATSYSCEGTGNGVTTKGAGIAIAQHTTQLPMTTNISGGVFSGVYGISIKNPQGVAQPSPTVNITSGDFRGSTSGITLNDSGYNTKIEKFISGGTFSSSVAEEYCADGYIPNNNGDGTFGVKVGEYVAQIGTTKYETLSGAIAAVPTTLAETTISLLKDTTEELMVITDKNIILDLNNKTLTGRFDLYKGNLTIDSGTLIGIAHINGSSDNNLTAGNYNKLIIGSGAIIKGGNAGGEYSVILWETNGNKGYGSQIDIYGKLERSLWVMGNITNGNSVINMYGTIDSPDVGIAENGHVTLNIYEGAKITAVDDAVEQRAGILNIFGGKLESTATSYSCESNPSGTAGGGAALIIAQHTTKLQLVTNIEGGVFSGLNGLGICNPQNNTAPTPSISIESGNFIGSNYGVMLNDDVYTKKVQNFISGGTFSSPLEESYCAEGYVPKDNGNNTYGVIPGYKVTFMNEGVQYLELNIEKNKTISGDLVVDPIKAGYTFTGWYKTGLIDKWDFSTAVTEAVTLYSKYDLDTYTVTYHANSGTISANSQTYTIESGLNSLLTPTRDGYDFSGWFDNSALNGEAVTSISGTGDRDLYAKWTAVNYSISYAGESSTVSGNPVGYNVEQPITLTNPTRDGYDFSGWTWTGQTTPVVAVNITGGTITGDITFTANWSPIIYTIEYNLNSGTVAPDNATSYTIESNITLTNPTRDGYDFSGWTWTGQTDPVVDVNINGWTGDKLFVANWTARTDIPYKVEHYQQNTGDNNYTLVTTDNLSGTTDQATAAVTKDYTGFTLSGDIAEYQTAIAGDKSTVVKLYYNRNPHTLKFVVDGVETTGTVVYGADITAPADPTKDSCNTFAGWTSSVDGLTTTGTMPDSDVTFTANWNYTCTRSSGGGGGGGSSRNNTNNMQEVVLGGEVEVNTGDEAEINTGDENKLDENNDNDENKGSIGNTQGYDPELVEAYKWAYKNGITTMPTIEEARLKDGITRAELAKMMVVFMSEVLYRQPVITETFDYPDVNEKALGDLTGYIQLAYQYQIMGINADGKALNKFNPRGKVSRAEFATVLSRVLYGSVNNQKGANYREKHIEALNKAGILTNTDPKIQELRGWIILMLYRSQKDGAENVETNPDINPESNTGDTVELTEAQTGAIAETTTGDVAELTGEVAELTGDIAELTGSTAELTGDTQEIEEKDDKESESLTGTEAAKPSETPSTGDAKAE